MFSISMLNSIFFHIINGISVQANEMGAIVLRESNLFYS